MSNRTIGYSFIGLFAVAALAIVLTRMFPPGPYDPTEVTTCEESPFVHHDPVKRVQFC